MTTAFEPSISIIILTKNNFSMFKDCVDSIFKHTSYENFSLYIGDTGSDDDQLELYQEYLKQYKGYVKGYVIFDYYHFPKNNNWIIENIATGSDYILFCNDDIVLQNDAISLMMKHVDDSVGTIGCKLLYPNNTIQHAGHLHIIPNNRDSINHYNVTHKLLNEPDRDIETCTVDGNTFAFCLVNTHTFLQMGRLNESYEHCFEDVGFCISCSRSNLKHLCIGNAVCIHHESISRRKLSTYISSSDINLFRNNIHNFYNEIK